jgi:hypothetical protein
MTTDGTPAEPEPAQGTDEDEDEEDVYSASEEDQIAARLEALGYID